MKISQIHISNILGITELDFTPEGFTEITGGNGTGKTSVLEAVKAALQSGHDATLLRKGAEKGEIVLVLEDGVEISKTVTATGSTATVRKDGKKFTRPADAIRTLTDALSVNPIEFLLAPKKDRVRALLEAMPMEVDEDRLAEVSGVVIKYQPGLHAMNAIAVTYQQIYDERTGTNRAITEKKGTILQLEAAIPPMPEGVTGDEDDLLEKIEVERATRDNRLESISSRITAILSEKNDEMATERQAAQEKIDAIKSNLESSLAEKSAFIAEQKRRAGDAADKAKAAYAYTVEPLQSSLAIIRNDREASGRRSQTLDTIAVLTTELETLTIESTEKTSALAKIEAYKSELLASLPIPGLEVRDGEIFRDDVAFDRLNTAQQVDVAVEVAKLRAGSLGVVCVDRIECLDSDAMEAFKKAALESGLQMFVTRVSSGDFRIETSD